MLFRSPTLGKASDLRPWRFTSLSLASLWDVVWEVVLDSKETSISYLLRAFDE